MCLPVCLSVDPSHVILSLSVYSRSSLSSLHSSLLTTIRTIRDAQIVITFLPKFSVTLYAYPTAGCLCTTQCSLPVIPAQATTSTLQDTIAELTRQLCECSRAVVAPASSDELATLRAKVRELETNGAASGAVQLCEVTAMLYCKSTVIMIVLLV